MKRFYNQKSIWKKKFEKYIRIIVHVLGHSETRFPFVDLGDTFFQSRPYLWIRNTQISTNFIEFTHSLLNQNHHRFLPYPNLRIGNSNSPPFLSKWSSNDSCLNILSTVNYLYKEEEGKQREYWIKLSNWFCRNLFWQSNLIELWFVMFVHAHCVFLFCFFQSANKTMTLIGCSFELAYN